MNIEYIGSFRTRIADDGSLDVWARGWRLESQLYALVPAGLALMFVFAPMAPPMRAVGALVMIVAALFVSRMTRPGLRFTREAVSIVSVVRTQRFPWEQVSGFMGERRHDEARVLMVLQDGPQIPLPGTLDAAELDPYDEEGPLLSAADQLNRLQELAVAGELAGLEPAPAAAAHASARVAPRASIPDTDEPTSASRKDRRRERKELRAALKAVRLTPQGTVVAAVDPEEQTAPRSIRRRGRAEPAAELTKVAITETDSIAVAPPAEAVSPESGIPSYYPTPVYIPQAEYAQMLRDQKAAEKAAAAAAAELRRLADVEVPDELAEKEAFSDWAS